MCVSLDGAVLVLSPSDKHSNSGSYGRRSHLESPPTFGYPSRHPHHHPSPRGSWNKSREREKRRGGRDRVDETSRGKVCVCQYLETGMSCVPSYSWRPCQHSVVVSKERGGRRCPSITCSTSPSPLARPGERSPGGDTTRHIPTTRNSSCRQSEYPYSINMYISIWSLLLPLTVVSLWSLTEETTLYIQQTQIGWWTGTALNWWSVPPLSTLTRTHTTLHLYL